MSERQPLALTSGPIWCPVNRVRRLAMWPARQYVRHAPTVRGKGFVIRRVLRQLLPAPPAGFQARLPGGGQVMLYYRETIGMSFLLNGGFESSEIQFLHANARRGTTVIDAGANVGVFTVPLARAVGSCGRVLAFEPLPANVARLRSNIVMNALDNVTVYQIALSDREAEMSLYLSDDPAYTSTTTVKQNRGTGESLAVFGTTLDRVWRENGYPSVSVVKIDVEGGELEVLRGCEEMMSKCKPTLMVEAESSQYLSSIVDWLTVRGYTRMELPHFMPWNHAFSCSEGIESQSNGHLSPGEQIR